MNYNQRTHFIIELDDIWKWLGFSSKQHSKVLLEKNFIIDIDYTKSLMPPHKQSVHIKGGHNKEYIMITPFLIKNAHFI